MAPDDLDSQVLLAGLLLETRQFDDAREVIAKGLLSHPGADALRLLDFQQHALQEQVDKAVAAMQSLIALKRNELAYRQGLALYLVRNERIADAEAVLRQAVTDMPERIEAKLALASFLAEREKSLQWLASLGQPDFSILCRTAFGEMAAGDMFAAWVAHDLLHLRQLVELHYAYNIQAVQPYSPLYAGDW